jgi:hypothetical protein
MISHPFDGSDHDGWCAICGYPRTAPVHAGQRRRCCACTEPFDVPDEPTTIEAYTCLGCRRRCLPPVPGWVEAWERSTQMQRELRAESLRRRALLTIVS